MQYHDTPQPDYGTGEKKLSTYTMGLIGCVILTLLSFWTVMSGNFTKLTAFGIIYLSAIIQFFIQIIYFIHLNFRTDQSRINVIAIAYTFVILVCIIGGSLWIMWNLNYNMIH